VISQNFAGVLMTTYSYDAAGNRRLQKPSAGTSTTYTWNDDNRLAAVASTPSTITSTTNYSYDTDGLRVTAGAIRHNWDGQNQLEERDSSNNLLVEYTFEPQQYGNLISQRQGSNSYFYQFDGLGSTDTLTDISQTDPNVYAYQAYGTLATLAKQPVANNLTFVGRLGYYNDTATNLIYVRNRWYDPSTATWTSRDPIGFAGGDANLNRYVGNNPVNATDPSGFAAINPANLLGNIQPCGSITTKYTIGAASIAKTESLAFGGCFGINNLTLTVLIWAGAIPGASAGVSSYSTPCANGLKCKCKQCTTIQYKRAITLGPIDLSTYEGKGLPRNCKIWVSVPVDVTATICIGICL
jgi:RHS repeat-associated protein